MSVDVQTSTVSADVDRVFSARHIAIASAIGSPIAGLVLMTINYFTWGHRDKGTQLMVLGTVATLAFLVLSPSFLPQLPAAVYWVVYGLLMWQVAESLQGKLIEACLAHGAEEQGRFRVLIISLASGLFAAGTIYLTHVLMAARLTAG